MDSPDPSPPPPAEWYRRAPAPLSIVTCYFPETDPEPDGSLKLRPALVLSILRDKGTGAIALRIAYGTSVLKLTRRLGVDLIIQNAVDMRIMGLPKATRFDLDEQVDLPYSTEFFACWEGYKTPVIGQLTEDYAKELAWLMYKRTQPDDE